MLNDIQRMEALAFISVKQELRWRLHKQGLPVKSYESMSTEELERILDTLTWEHPELRAL